MNNQPNQARVILDLSIDQASAVKEALDLYTRVCMGQLDAIEMLVRDGTVPVRSEGERTVAGMDKSEDVMALLKSIKQVLGYQSNGSMGIGHQHMHIHGRRSYELYKSLSKTIATHVRPNPDFRGVDYDGLSVRYTAETAPKTYIASEHKPVAEVTGFDDSDGSYTITANVSAMINGSLNVGDQLYANPVDSLELNPSAYMHATHDGCISSCENSYKDARQLYLKRAPR